MNCKFNGFGASLFELSFKYLQEGVFSFNKKERKIMSLRNYDTECKALKCKFNIF